MKLSLMVLLLLVNFPVTLSKKRRGKPGRCPLDTSLFPTRNKNCPFGSFQCSRDNECSGGDKCCGCPKTCVEPLLTGRNNRQRRPRPGKRPRGCLIEVARPLPSICRQVTIINECVIGGRTCPGNEICCPASTCGGSQCVKQSTRKSPPSNNRCPAVPRRKPAICKQVRVGFTCKRGQSCPRAGEICCPGKCGGTTCVRRGGNQPAALG
ncbi:hypothetical protein EB796_012276 [Bugula neritina]|uniref:WAP domain-containing protein n=1 Tax=Bugula neritina TaxID=10212 RepID=A0A7J7JTR5_BUGNE|nr:hypothetical protein EB796_012276 [Bugula neritina]